MQVEPLNIRLPEERLEDLKQRLVQTRWPDEVEGAGWDYGVPRQWLQQLTAYWAGGFDWRAIEARVNAVSNYRAMVDGVGIHFLHAHGSGPDPLPLLLIHGWPSSFVEMLDILPLLTDPASHGGTATDAFDVVVPSLPGYGFSDKPNRRGFSYGDIAGRFVTLMEGLGYPRFVAHSHDHGAAIMGRVSTQHRGRLIGYHTTEPGIPSPHIDPADPGLSNAERAYLAYQQEWSSEDNGYARIQATRPQTLAYGLTDSPVGLAAWILDKWQAWTAPPNGDLLQLFTMDQLLANVTLYWLTETANSSARAYYEGVHDPNPLAPDAKITVPTGVALVARQPIERVPREYAERRFSDIRRWVELPRGGHFLAGEEPSLLAEALRDFFHPLREQ